MVVPAEDVIIKEFVGVEPDLLTVWIRVFPVSFFSLGISLVEGLLKIEEMLMDSFSLIYTFFF